MGKRDQSGDEASPIDLTASSSKVYEDLTKHRTCWLHNVAYTCDSRKKITVLQAKRLRSFELTSPCFAGTSPTGRRSKKTNSYENDTTESTTTDEKKNQRTKNDNTRQKKKLNSLTFQCCFENLWKNFPDDKRSCFAYLDCLWFNSYIAASSKEKVLARIKKKQIFSKRYVLIPIVRWNHWCLLIFCNFDEIAESENRSPCMLLLDSLEKANPRRLEPDIRKLVLDIYKAEGREVDRHSISRIPLLVPQVPQQRDDEECGNFVLYYINQFVQGAPEKFSIEDYPYFMDRNWFNRDKPEDFSQLTLA